MPDMPHPTKNIVTSLELSSSKTSKHNLMIGKVPINMQMINEIWLKCDGASGQLQSTKLTSRHFEKNANSCMNVKLATRSCHSLLLRWFVVQYPMRVLCSACASTAAHQLSPQRANGAAAPPRRTQPARGGTSTSLHSSRSVSFGRRVLNTVAGVAAGGRHPPPPRQRNHLQMQRSHRPFLTC